MDSQSEGETQPATQFEGGSDDAESLYEAKAILDERTRIIRGKSVGQYLVDWAGRDENGKPWDPTWQKKGDCTNELIKEWKAIKLRDPGIVGRWQAAEAERKKQEAESKTQARASASARRSGRASSRAGSVASSRGEKRKRSETADDVLKDVVTPRRRKRELKSVETAWSAGPISESALSSPEKATRSKRGALSKGQAESEAPHATAVLSDTPSQSPVKSKRSTRNISKRDTVSTGEKAQTPRLEDDDEIMTSDDDDVAVVSKRTNGKGKEPVRPSAGSRHRDSARGQVRVYGSSAVRPLAPAPSLADQIFGDAFATGSDGVDFEEATGEDPTDPVENAEDLGEGSDSELSEDNDRVIVEIGPRTTQDAELSDEADLIALDAGPKVTQNRQAGYIEDRTGAAGQQSALRVATTPANKGKRVAFAETQESDESVVPGTLSTVQSSQPSEEVEVSSSPLEAANIQPELGQAIASQAASSSPRDDSLRTLSDITPTPPEDDVDAPGDTHVKVKPDLEELQAQAEECASEPADDMIALDGSQDEDQPMAEFAISLAADVDRDLTTMSEAGDVSLDADLPASQTELFQAAVAMMADHGYEDDSESSQGQMSAVISSANEINRPTGATSNNHAGSSNHIVPSRPPRARVDLAATLQAAWMVQRSSPERPAFQPLAHIRPPVLGKADLPTVADDPTLTQETIDQFSSPNKSPAPVRKRAQAPISQSGLASNDMSDSFVPEDVFQDHSNRNTTELQVTATSVEPPCALNETGAGHLKANGHPTFTKPPDRSNPPMNPADNADVPIDRNASIRPPMQKTPFGDAIQHAPTTNGLDESARQELQKLTKLSSEQATRIEALETTVSNLNERTAALNQTIESLRASLASSNEDLELHRNLYGEARDRAVELTRGNSALEERLSVLKSQLDLGLKQQKLHAQAEVDRVERENVQLKNKLAFLLEQNRSTGDAIRHRAAQYPKLQYEHYKLAEAVLKERRKAADAQQALKQANKEVSRLERQLDICAPSDESDSESGIDEDDLEEYPTVDDLVAKGYTLPQTRDKDTADVILTGPSASAIQTARSDMPDPIPHGAPAVLPEPSASQSQDPVAASGAEPSTAIDNRGASSAEIATKNPPSLLQFLEESFASTALPFGLRIDVVRSQPKKTSNTATLFPYSYDHYKVWESRILITVTGQVPESDNTSPLMVSALEAYVFTIPATLSTVIYISKVDSSGYPILPSKFKAPALTNLLVTSFLTYQCAARTRPTPRVYCRLFARAQKQYLFANSSEGGAKKVLTGLGLCKWWRSVFEKVVLNVEAEQERETGDIADATRLNCWLPGIDPAEAKNQMGPSKVPGAAHLIWSYGPPFEESESTPLYPNRYDTTLRKLACLIPRFEDDPKGRYLDELVINASNKSQAALRRDGASNPTKSQSSGEITSKAIQQKRREDETRLRREAALSLEKYKPADFWETLSARQDCYPGDQTGFLGVSFGPASSSSGLVTSEQIKSLETSLDKAIGFNLKIVGRLVTALLNHDFGTRAYAMTGTGRFLSEMERILSAEIGTEAWRQRCLVKTPKNAEAVESPAATANPQVMGTPVNVLKPVRKKAKSIVSQPAPSSRPNAMAARPPGQAYHCKWRLGDQTQCLSLWATAEDFERHVISHIS